MKSVALIKAMRKADDPHALTARTPQAICSSIPLPFTKFEFYYFLSLSFLIISKLGSLISNFFCPLPFNFFFFPFAY